LLANSKCVVSETGLDRTLETPFADGVAFAARDEIADTCLRLLRDDGARRALGQAGFECFSKLRQADYLKKALAATREAGDAILA
jgi:hypothetical protein